MRREHRRSQRGMVTAETAIVLPLDRAVRAGADLDGGHRDRADPSRRCRARRCAGSRARRRRSGRCRSRVAEWLRPARPWSVTDAAERGHGAGRGRGRGARLAAGAAAGGAPRVAGRRSLREGRVTMTNLDDRAGTTESRRQRRSWHSPGSSCSRPWPGSAMLVAAATARQHHVDGAADLVAVSAASACSAAATPARSPSDFASRNDVVLRSCRVDGDDVVIAVR